MGLSETHKFCLTLNGETPMKLQHIVAAVALAASGTLSPTCWTRKSPPAKAVKCP